MTSPIRTIVVGVAEMSARDPALLAAVDMARRSGAALHAVHAFVLSAPIVADGMLPYPGYEPAATYLETAAQDFARSMRAFFPDDRITCHAFASPAAAAIVETAENVNADVVVVGATRHGRVGRWLLGTTAQRVLRESPGPVFVVRTAPVLPRRVLVTTDLSRASASVFERGMEVLEGIYGPILTELRAILVVSPLPAPAPLSTVAVERAAADALDEFLAEQRPRAISATPLLRFGTPEIEIAHEADRWLPDLVVLGTHARRAPTRWLLGSVAEGSLKGLRCNVLVIPPDAQRPPEAAAAGAAAGSSARAAEEVQP